MQVVGQLGYLDSFFTFGFFFSLFLLVVSGLVGSLVSSLERIELIVVFGVFFHRKVFPIVWFDLFVVPVLQKVDPLARIYCFQYHA